MAIVKIPFFFKGTKKAKVGKIGKQPKFDFNLKIIFGKFLKIHDYFSSES